MKLASYYLGTQLRRGSRHIKLWGPFAAYTMDSESKYGGNGRTMLAIGEARLKHGGLINWLRA